MSTNKADDLRMEWEPGQLLLGDFEVQRVLGQGGMGKVYLVRSRTTATDFAVKHALFTDDNSRQNFLSELQTWIDLPEHPHIAACRFFRTIGDEIAIFSEYVSGGTLAEWIQKRRLTTLEQIVDVSIQFAWGLRALHEHGLIHQDVKPGNVLMTSEGIAKVADFGLARARLRGGHGQFYSPDTAPSGESVLVSFGGMTQAYCSPEQAAKQPLSRKTDIWSWGVSVLDMFYCDVSCRYGQAAGKVLEAYVNEESVDAELMQMPADMAAVLRKTFQSQPEQRWAHMNEVADALTQLYQKVCSRDYPRQKPDAAFRNGTQVQHDRRAVSGVQWTDPREWLATVLQLEGADLSDPQLRAVPAARTRKAQAIEDLAIYDNVQRRFERLVASGRGDLEMQLSMVQMDKALVHKTAGDPQGASSMYERAAAIREKLALHGTSENADNLALVYQNHASLLFDLGDKEKSLELCDRAIEIRKRLVVEQEQEKFADGLAVLYMNKGVALAALDQADDAVSTYDEAIGMLERLTHVRSDRDLERDLARAYQNKALSLRALMRFVQAFRSYDKAIAILGRLISKGHSELRVDLSGVWTNKARLLLDLERYEANVALSRQALEMLEELVITEGRTELAFRLARGYATMANALLTAGEYKAGLAASAKEVDAWNRVVNVDGRHEFLPELQQAVANLETNRRSLANREDISAAYPPVSTPNPTTGVDAVSINLHGKSVPELIPIEFEALLKRAKELAAEGHIPIADMLCGMAYNIRPEDAELLAVAAECSLELGQFNRASILLHSLVEIEPSNKWAWEKLALCAAQRSSRKQQIFALQMVIALDPQDGLAHDLLADALVAERQLDEAMLILARMKEIAGCEVQAVCKWAQLLAETGRALVGYFHLNKSLEINQRHPALWYTMATILKPLPKFRENALIAAENALLCLREHPQQLHPQHHALLNELIRELREQA